MKKLLLIGLLLITVPAFAEIEKCTLQNVAYAFDKTHKDHLNANYSRKVKAVNFTPDGNGTGCPDLLHENNETGYVGNGPYEMKPLYLVRYVIHEKSGKRYCLYKELDYRGKNSSLATVCSLRD